MAHNLNLAYSFARGVRGQRLQGMYHHQRGEDAAIFKGVHLDKLAVWGQDVRTANTSCGTVVEVGGGTVTGLYIREVPIGPFRG